MGLTPCVTAVIFNPSARGNKARRFVHEVSRLNPQTKLLPTTAAGDATRLAVEAAHDGADIIVAAGGDGTVNEVVNGLASLPRSQRPSFGVLPLGTINVFAKEIGLSGHLETDWAIIRAGHSQLIDLALAEHSGGQRWFVQMAGAGLDAAAIDRVQWRLKKVAGPIAYLWAGIGALLSPLPVVQATGGPTPTGGQLVLLGNGRFYGGRFPVFPKAKLNDGRLDLAVLPKASILSLTRAAIAVRTGRLLKMSGIVHQQEPQFELTCPSPARFQVEGDNIGSLPARFSVQPEALRILIPRR